MSLMNYKKRYLSAKIAKWFFKGKAIVIIGARQVGKTTMLQYYADNTGHSVLWLNADDPAIRTRLTNPGLEDIKGIIGNYEIVVIDEVQRVENVGLLLKMMVDNFKKVQFVATGSSALEISDRIFEPLTGRQILFYLYPFSLAELYPKKSPFEIEQQLPFHLIYGSYPDVCKHRDDAETLLVNLSGQYLYKDVLVWKDIRKPELLDKLLKLLAHQCCSEVSLNELANQLKVKVETVENYIDLLEKSFVVFRLKAYSTNERKEVTKMNKILFWDNGIRNAIIGDFRPLNLRNDVGCLWENFMISERMKMNSWMGSNRKSYFWRNLQQREVDYIEVEHDKLYGFEMKFNMTKKHRITKAFTNMYPDAQTEIITPRNFSKFCLLE
ncbi:MAG: ATP-binding protein [Bacteroidetes bacterium]|nr:ATP-binding protein [Bacteroidota bacterium]